VTTLIDRWRPVLTDVPEWDPPRVPTLVVVPHPDDEALATGGLIARQRRAGVRVHVIAVSDGEAAYPSSDAVDLAALRRQEQQQSLVHLGVPADEVTHLAIPDGHVGEHEEHLAEVIACRLDDVGLVVAPWPNDQHTDHEAAGRAARSASRHRDIELVYSLFWAWHHTPLGTLVDAPLVAVSLDDELSGRRLAAVQSHRSQLTDLVAPPILSPADVESASWPREHYLRSGAEE
jgi:LmbE family N-acetylglucosaminyl deacetylase